LTYIDNNSNSFKIQYDASADIANIGPILRTRSERVDDLN